MTSNNGERCAPSQLHRKWSEYRQPDDYTGGRGGGGRRAEARGKEKGVAWRHRRVSSHRVWACIMAMCAIAMAIPSPPQEELVCALCHEPIKAGLLDTSVPCHAFSGLPCASPFNSERVSSAR